MDPFSFWFWAKGMVSSDHCVPLGYACGLGDNSDHAGFHSKSSFQRSSVGPISEHGIWCLPELSWDILPAGPRGTPAQLLPGLPAERRGMVATLRAGGQVKVWIY